MSLTAAELQKRLVVALAHGIGDPWERIVVNYDMQDDDGGLTDDRRGFSITSDGTGGGFRKGGVAFDATVKGLFRELRAEMRRTDGVAWGTCDLVVDQPGRFRFGSSYEPPKRINGVFDDESMERFDRYPETYPAERAGG